MHERFVFLLIDLFHRSSFPHGFVIIDVLLSILLEKVISEYEVVFNRLSKVGFALLRCVIG